MEYPIKICRFYKSAKDSTFCRECGICIGQCELDQQECKNPLLKPHEGLLSKLVCPKHNKTEDELNAAINSVFAKSRKMFS